MRKGLYPLICSKLVFSLSNDLRGMTVAEKIDCKVSEDAPTLIRVVSTVHRIVCSGRTNDVTFQPATYLGPDHLLIIISINKIPDFKNSPFLIMGKSSENAPIAAS